MSRGVPSVAAQVRLRDAMEREVDDLRDELRQGLLWSSVLSRLGQPRAAAGVLAEQKIRVDRFEHRVAAAVAAAAVEREAEDVVARVIRADAQPHLRVRPLRVAFAAATSLVTAATGVFALRSGAPPVPATVTALAAPATIDDETVSASARHREARAHLSTASRAIASLAAGDGDVEITAARAHASVLAATSGARTSSVAYSATLDGASVEHVLTEVVPLLHHEHDLLATLAAAGDSGAIRALEDLHNLVATLVAIEPTLATSLPQVEMTELVAPPVTVVATEAPEPTAVAEPTEIVTELLPEPEAEPTPAEASEDAPDEPREPRPAKSSPAPREEPTDAAREEPSDDGATATPEDEPGDDPSDEPRDRPTDEPSEDDGLLGFEDGVFEN